MAKKPAPELPNLVTLSGCPMVANYSAEFIAAFERAARRVLEPHAATTRKTYQTAWNRWVEHCNRVHVRALPIEPSHLVTYLESLTELAPNSVRQYLSALCALDCAARITSDEPNPDSIRQHVYVTRWLTSWGRDNPRAPKRKAPAASASDIERILIQAQDRRPCVSYGAHLSRYARDRAILVFGVLGAMRASELAQLQAEDVRTTADGIELVIRRSKTDQHGEGVFKGLMRQATALTCPVDAWRQWQIVRGKHDGPAFNGIARNGSIGTDALTPDTIGLMVKKRARDAGVKLTGHSMRATFATLARSAGKPLDRIMKQGAWTEPRTALGYMRQMDLFVDNASDGLLS